MKPSWDIFCSIVDNYGDIGVCWRLSRQLSMELKMQVRLWVDDLALFRRLCRDVDPQRENQTVSGVTVRRWNAEVADAVPADVVVEGFGARLPEPFIGAMAARIPRPAWINFEYLSAESWIEGCHGLPSPQSRVPLTKYFFFPGFTPQTGGLLIERDLVRDRDAFRASAAARDAFWDSIGVERPSAQATAVSLFCYENAALPALVDAWSSGATPILLVVPEGKALAQLSRHLGKPVNACARLVIGQLTIAATEFLDFDRYDRLLWACDVNFVRGEDSFVRAQLAGRPLVWQAYPQAEQAHHQKVSAFLDRYGAGLDASVRAIHRELTDAWNRKAADVATIWREWQRHRGVLEVHAKQWAAQLAHGGSAAQKLTELAEKLLK